MSQRSAPGADRRFFLEEIPPAPPRLLASDAEHARVVLRMQAGDACTGLDGRGHSWPLRVVHADRKRFEVALAGEPTSEPAPGEAGASLPWIEVAFAPPRGARAEDLLDALVQLGAAAVTPLVTARGTPYARGEGDARRERWERVAREACKQSCRRWMPELNAACDFDAFVARVAAARADVVRLDPRARTAFDAPPDAHAGDAPARGTRARPLVLAIGPEGGFTPEEERALDAIGARAVRLAPHVLRIETAAQAALAVVVARTLRT